MAAPVPTVIVAPDTAGYSNYYGELVRRGVTADFVNGWLDRSRDSLARCYPAFADFAAGFEVSDGVLDELVPLGDERGVAFDADGFAVSSPVLRIQLKGLARSDCTVSGPTMRWSIRC